MLVWQLASSIRVAGQCRPGVRNLPPDRLFPREVSDRLTVLSGLQVLPADRGQAVRQIPQVTAVRGIGGGQFLLDRQRQPVRLERLARSAHLRLQNSDGVMDASPGSL